MSLLSITNLGRRVGGKWVLWDVTLDVEPGEILAVFGATESGKTALARVVAGLDDPTSGTLRLEAAEGGEPFQVSLGMSFPAFAPELSVYENLDLFASLWGLSRRSRGKEIAFLLELVGLADQRSSRPEALSSGAARRMEIARALIANSPLTILDGLLDTLDRSMLEKLWDHFLTMRRGKDRSFLILTGSSKVAELCGRVAVLHKGKVVYSGRPDDFRRLGGEDLVVLGDLSTPALRNKIEERLSVVIKEEDGFLSFRVANGERMVTDILAEFGSDIGCVYLKRPTLDDALAVLSGGAVAIVAGASRGEQGRVAE